MSKLKSCPFCGGEAKSSGYFNGGTGNSWEIVTCSKCGVSQPITKYYSMPQATAAWNRRADAVPVVRCGECRYRELAKVNCKGYTICPASGMEITDDDFCSYGERKEDRK